MALPTLIWLSQNDLEDATSRATVLACFDDDNLGTPSQTGIAAVIQRAEQEVLSYLSEYGPPPFSAATIALLQADPFLKGCALEYAVYYMYDRAPEVIRQSKGDLEKRLAAADKRMERVLDARQRPPTVPITPANVGGAVVDGANRIYVPNPDGTSNAGDY